MIREISELLNSLKAKHQLVSKLGQNCHGLANAIPDDLRVIADMTQFLTDNGYTVTNDGWKSFF